MASRREVLAGLGSLPLIGACHKNMDWLGPANRSISQGGTFNNGDLLTINGTNFGSKSRSLTPLQRDKSTATLGTVDSQWLSGNKWPTAAAAQDNIQLVSGGTQPSGSSINPPHPYVTAFYRGAHNNSGSPPNTNPDWVYLSCQLTIPTSPSVFYARWYERSDPAWSGWNSSNDNYKKIGWASSGPGIQTHCFFTGFNPTVLMDNSTVHFQETVGDNGGVLENPDRNGNNSFWHQVLNPWRAANGWLQREIEFQVTTTTGPSGTGFINYWCNGGVPTGNGEGLVVAYAGSTDVTLTGTTRYFTVGGGVYTDMYPIANNFDYLCDIYMDITGTNVSQHCARVILGDQNTHDSSSIRVPLDIASWSNTQITGNIWKDRFNSGQTAYVHVVTESNGIQDNVMSIVFR